MKKKKYSAFAIAKENTYLVDRLSSVVRVNDVVETFYGIALLGRLLMQQISLVKFLTI